MYALVVYFLGIHCAGGKDDAEEVDGIEASRQTFYVYYLCHGMIAICSSEHSAADYFHESLNEYFHVEKTGTVVEIFYIHVEAAQHLFHRIGVAVMQSGIRRYSRTQLKNLKIACVVLKDFVNIIFPFRTRPDKAHVAFQHVPQLWQLVKVMTAQEAADVGEALVAFHLKQLRLAVLSVDAHAAELIYVKGMSVAAYALLLIDDGQAVFKAYGCCADEQQW